MSFKFSLGKAKEKAKGLAGPKSEEAVVSTKYTSVTESTIANTSGEQVAQNKSILGEEHDAEAHAPEEDDVYVPVGNKRHFTARKATGKSGPGTLEPSFVGSWWPQGKSRYNPAVSGGPTQTENVYLSVVAKVSNLPPAIDQGRVADLFKDFPALKVTKIESLPPLGPSTKGRPSTAMKVTFNKDADARSLNDAINKLNDKKYMGKGYYLHLDRYLGDNSTAAARQSEPFGAHWEGPDMTRRFAPAPDLGGNTLPRSRDDNGRLIVTVNQPPDVSTVRLVHQTIEGVLLGGMEFEAALMNDPQVQEEERFAWLYDQKHPVNRYYRWRMHQIVCGSQNTQLFDGKVDWQGPKRSISDEFAHTRLAFDSESEDVDGYSSDEAEKPKFATILDGDNYPSRVDNGYGIMSPRSRAYLLWMLTSLPSANTLCDEPALITAFAIKHAQQGMDEVINILVSNILQPLKLTDANTKNRKSDAANEDIRKATILALRILSNVMLVAPTVPGPSYKYRRAIGIELRERGVFEHLEELPLRLSMGMLGKKDFRDSINLILGKWRVENMLEQDILDHLDSAFNAREKQLKLEEEQRKLAEKKLRKGKVVIKRVVDSVDRSENDESRMDIDKDMGAIERAGAGIVEMEEGMMPPEDAAAQANPASPAQVAPALVEEADIPGESAAARARRLRPKAEDMFNFDEK